MNGDNIAARPCTGLRYLMLRGSCVSALQRRAMRHGGGRARQRSRSRFTSSSGRAAVSSDLDLHFCLKAFPFGMPAIHEAV